MPSNKELSTEAHKLAEELGTSVRTWSLNNRELQDLVDDLRRRRAGQGEEPAQVDEEQPQPETTDPKRPRDWAPPPPPQPKPDPPAAAAPAPKTAERERGGYVIAPGISLTSLRGVLGPGTAVTAADFSGGQQTIDDLLANGSLVSGQADADGAA